MSAARHLAPGLGLLVLVLAGWLVLGWLDAPGGGVSVTTPRTEVSAGSPSGELAGVRRDALAATDRAPAAGQLEGEPASAARRPRSCPDLDEVLAELVAQLESEALSVGQVYEPAVALVADRLDAHCLALLFDRGADELSSASERLAALSLVRRAQERSSAVPAGEGDPARPMLALTPGARRLLELAFDQREEGPVALRGLDGLPEYASRVHRDQLARVAGSCLAVLGDDGDRARLVDALDDTLLCHAARASLAHTTSSRVAAALAERLADPERPMTQAGLALRELLGETGGPTLDPDLRRRAAEGVLERWRRLGPDGSGVQMCHVLLLTLDPDMAASRWAELLDAGQVPAHRLALAASALTCSGHPPDIARLEGLLVQGDDSERLAVASVVLLHAPTGALATGLVSRASDTLAEVYRASPDPLVRRKILYAARIGPPELVPLALQALRADEAMIVREAAVLCLQPSLASDPRVREALARAAAEDPEDRVRRAAAQALR